MKTTVMPDASNIELRNKRFWVLFPFFLPHLRWVASQEPQLTISPGKKGSTLIAETGSWPKYLIWLLQQYSYEDT